ncbi:MAG: creatininase family protein [Promethearchaeia archaeon]
MPYVNHLKGTWKEFQEMAEKKDSIVLIPIGCIEEHGPHLPINTDGIIAEKMCKHVAKETDIILGPTVRFGVSRTTQGFPGTLEFRVETLKSLMYDIVYSYATQEIKNIVIFTWHGGTSHSTVLREACIDVLEAIRKERDFPLRLSKEQFEKLPHIYLLSGVRLFDGKIEQKILSILETEPYHAAELETSLMLFLAPGLVRKSELEGLTEFPEFPEERIFARGNLWLEQGLMGDASAASKSKGKKIYEIFIKTLKNRINSYKI